MESNSWGLTYAGGAVGIPAGGGRRVRRKALATPATFATRSDSARSALATMQSTSGAPGFAPMRHNTAIQKPVSGQFTLPR